MTRAVRGRGAQGVRGPRRARVVALLLAVGAALACGDRDAEPPPGPGTEAPSTDTAAVDTLTPDTGAVDTTGVGYAPGAEPAPPAADGPLTGFDTVFAYFTARDETRRPVGRPVADTADALRAAFDALLEGPTPAERDRGLLSWFSDETAGMVRSVTVRDGFAVVDFRDLRPVIPNAVGSAGALMLLGELTATAFQFPGIRRVEFRIDGDCDALMAWLQFGCYPIVRGGWDPPDRHRMAVEARPDG